MSTDYRALAPYGKTPEQARLDRAAEAGKTAADTSFESVLSAQPPAALALPEPVPSTPPALEDLRSIELLLKEHKMVACTFNIRRALEDLND
jgi:hypothetical protein